MSFILHSYDAQHGFHTWQRLTNPDIYLLQLDIDKPMVRRIWPAIYSSKNGIRPGFHQGEALDSLLVTATQY